MKVRERIEDQESAFLSPYASKSKLASRKIYEEPCPFRTEFQRDRDRIIHSKAFRRLKHKTQVYFSPGDHYRMRMTHSLEVSQISRTIARGLMLNEDLTEAIALGHDVGHTPFGHAGEYALQKIIGEYRHNVQSLRVVEHLEKNGKGLNLTEAVKDGILNHTGAHFPATLEGNVVRRGDRIAYLCHDYDDSIRAGMLKSSDLPGNVALVLGTKPSEMITVMVSDIIECSFDRGIICMSVQVENAMEEFRDFMFAKIYHSKELAPDREKACYVIQKLYDYFVLNSDKLPAEYIERKEIWGLETTIVDYIAGLTDVYAIELFEKLFIPAKWKIYTKKFF
ncbi:Deoxyguanosinetriphosphate triphosphohydrolase-like protein [Propionispora sp. 2/2-37]|uniref:deoxyguanosinetriphosphate triphosphohydrolase n=1 Tax=Propionispora sp. 2/2-37 TaxID=1677858 RepID=UPI0006BB54DB|nr:deoxyguanosinetriphosphate triphosphohydrolase [Propionispora sp. 2/2-37]CUH94172.1 Deoxyguanosinetriphosphate triphosphohydrolase-like protein [Propionispora sp. 2/2-37]